MGSPEEWKNERGGEAAWSEASWNPGAKLALDPLLPTPDLEAFPPHPLLTTPTSGRGPASRPGPAHSRSRRWGISCRTGFKCYSVS